MTGDQSFSFLADFQNDLGISAAHELGNIMAGSYLTALSDFTNLDLYPSVPALSVDMFGAIISYGLLEVSQVSDYAIVIDTALYEADTLSSVTDTFSYSQIQILSKLFLKRWEWNNNGDRH